MPASSVSPSYLICNHIITSSFSVAAILNVLRCVCYSCGQLLVNYDDPRFIAASRTKNPKARLAKLLALCRTKRTCDPSQSTFDGEQKGCGSVQPKYKRENINIIVDFSSGMKENINNYYDDDEGALAADGMGGDTKRILSAEEALTIFRQIPPDECRFLGFDSTLR